TVTGEPPPPPPRRRARRSADDAPLKSQENSERDPNMVAPPATVKRNALRTIADHKEEVEAYRKIFKDPRLGDATLGKIREALKLLTRKWRSAQSALYAPQRSTPARRRHHPEAAIPGNEINEPSCSVAAVTTDPAPGMGNGSDPEQSAAKR